jgi:hypothetical protein
MSTGAPALDPRNYANTAAPGRECGSCTLCCKVYEVPDLNKPAGRWCAHCAPGRGCGIHATRPDNCRTFYCLYMTEGWLGPEWKPDRSHFSIAIDPISRFMNVQVDPGQPKSWRKEPYLGQFRRWAQALLPEHRLVVVLVGKHATVVTHEGEIELGVMGPDDRVEINYRMTPNGPVHDILLNRAPAA